MPAGQRQSGTFHFFLRVFHGAKIGPDSCQLLLVSRHAQDLHRGLLQVHLFFIILGHICGLHIRPFQKLLRHRLEQRGLARPVFPDDADLLASLYIKRDIPGKHPPLLPVIRRRFQTVKRKVQYYLARRNRQALVEFYKDGILGLRHLRHAFGFPFKTLFHGFDRLHLLFQQSCTRGVLSGNRVQLMVYPLINALPLFLSGFFFPSVVQRFLLLLLHAFSPPSDILRIGQPCHRITADVFSAELLQMDNHICRPLYQGLVVGDKKDNVLKFHNQLFQPFQGKDIYIVGGLVEKQHRGLRQQKPRHLHLYLLSARQRIQTLVTVEEALLQLKLPGQPVDFFRVRLPKTGLLGKISADAFAQVLTRQLLGQIPQSLPAVNIFPFRFAVSLYQRRVINPP